VTRRECDAARRILLRGTQDRCERHVTRAKETHRCVANKLACFRRWLVLRLWAAHSNDMRVCARARAGEGERAREKKQRSVLCRRCERAQRAAGPCLSNEWPKAATMTAASAAKASVRVARHDIVVCVQEGAQCPLQLSCGRDERRVRCDG
jgi:hypothetical protein